MSVIQANRRESSVQFVTNMRELVIATIRRCLKLPKRMTFYVGQKICNNTISTYEKIIKIKDLYDLEYISNRILLCKECISELKYLSSMIAIIKEICDTSTNCKIIDDKTNICKKDMDSKLKTKAYISWANEIEDEIKLLQGLIKKDKERLKQSNEN